MSQSGTAGSYGNSIFLFLRTLHTVFHSGYTNLHSHQLCMRVSFSAHTCQYSSFVVFLVLAILTFWNANTLATCCEELTHLKRPWCWERLKAGGEGDDGGWDGWMASPTRWTQVWVSSRNWWWTGRPGVLQSMGSQRVRHNWVTELTDSDSAILTRYWSPPAIVHGGHKELDTTEQLSTVW